MADAGCVGFCVASHWCVIRLRGSRRTAKVGIGHLQIMPRRHSLAVTHPDTNDVKRAGLGQFRFSCGSKFLEQLWPRCQTGFANDPLQLCSKIRIAASIASNDPLRSRFSLLEDLFKVRLQLEEYRQLPGFPAFVAFDVLGCGTHRHSALTNQAAAFDVLRCDIFH